MTEVETSRLYNVVSRVLGISEREAPTASAEATPAWDSLNHLNLIMAIEQEFTVRFPADAIGELDTVPRIRSFVDRLGPR